MKNLQDIIKINPFAEHIPVSSIILDNNMQEGLTRMRNFLALGTLAVIFARTGMGKTTLVRLLLNEIYQSRTYEPYYMHLSSVKYSCFLRNIVSLLDEKPKLGKDMLYKQIFEKAVRLPGTMVLIIDEAHQLSNELLTDLRMLISGIDDSGRIKILLVGQNLLKDNLRQDCVTDLRERVCIKYQLRTFDEVDTIEYINARLKMFKVNVELFSDKCKKLIHLHSMGVPRVINNICTSCLVQGVFMKRDCIDEDVFRSIKEEVLP